jgi:hypothetical protein
MDNENQEQQELYPESAGFSRLAEVVMDAYIESSERARGIDPTCLNSAYIDKVLRDLGWMDDEDFFWEGDQ